jgi:hypothetical protein
MKTLTAARDERAVWVVLGAFVLVTVFFVNLFPPQRGGEFSQSPNEFSRFDLVVSMAERGTFAIDRELARFGDHEDKSSFGGHFYSNKAPGLSFAALPFYLLYRSLLGSALAARPQAIFFLVRLSTVSSACFVALYFLSRRLRSVSGESGAAAAVLFAVAFGTPFLIYARSFFSHAWTASLIYLAFEWLHPLDGRKPRLLWAGFFAGWAVLSEYPVALLAAVLLADAVHRRGVKGGALFLAGALPAAALLGFYDARCFGGVFELSSRHESYRGYTALSRSSFVGFGLPSPRIAWSYLFSPSRGVLFQSPFFVLLPAAFWSSALRSLSWRRARNVSAAGLALFFVAMCGYENWHGGWALGSRYLLPAVLLASWPLSSVARPGGSAFARWYFAIAASFAAAYFFLSGSTFWFLPREPENTLRFYSGFWLSRGWITPTLAGSGWLALTLPLAATIAAAVAAFRPFFRDAGRAVLALAGGALLCGLLFLGPPPRGRFGDRLTRARLLEGFTSLDLGLDELRRR